MCAVDQNVTVVVNTGNKLFTAGIGTDGAIYQLDAATGQVLGSATNFGGSVYHSVLAVFGSYQVCMQIVSPPA